MYSCEQNISCNCNMEDRIKAHMPMLDRRHLIYIDGCAPEQLSIYGEFSGMIFDTDLSVVAATHMHWRSPRLGSQVAITPSSTKTT